MWAVEDKIMQITKEERCINRRTEDNNAYIILTQAADMAGRRKFDTVLN
jgi:hypothetical protein